MSNRTAAIGVLSTALLLVLIGWRLFGCFSPSAPTPIPATGDDANGRQSGDELVGAGQRLGPLSVELESEVPIVTGANFLVSFSGSGESFDVSVETAANGILRVVDTSSSSSLWERPTVHKLTNGHQSFHLPAVPYGRYDIQARRIDAGTPFLASEVVPVAVPDRRRVVLRLVQRRDECQIIVALRSSFPLSGATVTAQEGDRVLLSMRMSERKDNPNEFFARMRLPAGRDIQIVVGHFEPGGLILGLPTPQHVKTLPATTILADFRTNDGNRTCFVARDRFGESIPFRLSLWRVSDDNNYTHVPIADGVVTERDGRVWCIRLPKGRYAARLSPEFRYSVSWREVSVESPSEIETVVEEGGGRAKLRFVDSVGASLADTRVNLNVDAEDLHQAYSLPTRTDSSGQLVTPPIPRGQYFIILWDRKLARTAGLDEGVDLTIELPASNQLVGTAAIKGSLRDSSGAPCPFAPIYLEVHPNWWLIANADADGLFSFDAIADGTHRVIVPRYWDSTSHFSTYRGTITAHGSGSELKTIVLPPP